MIELRDFPPCFSDVIVWHTICLQRIRPGEPLLAERYITNPQYGVCGAGNVAAPIAVPGSPAPLPANKTNEPQVTLLERNALTFVEEVGEGCFGKVYKGNLNLFLKSITK